LVLVYTLIDPICQTGPPVTHSCRNTSAKIPPAARRIFFVPGLANRRRSVYKPLVIIVHPGKKARSYGLQTTGTTLTLPRKWAGNQVRGETGFLPIQKYLIVLKRETKMNEPISYENLKDRIIEIRGQRVLLDSDVAEIYGVETKRINEAVKNNPEKFPDGYIVELDQTELGGLRSKFSTAKFVKTMALPKAFPEKGLYMLATILKSPQAVRATLAIIETFAKVKQLSRNIRELSSVQGKDRQKSLLQEGGELIEDVFGEDLETSGSETSIEINFAVVKFKHSVQKKKKRS